MTTTSSKKIWMHGWHSRRLKTLIRQIGPTLILAAVVIGPGSLTLSTIAGSTYRYQLLWATVVATFFMIIYVWLSARISLVTGDTLLGVTRKKYGSGLAKLGGVFGFLSVLAFQAGNTAAVGFAANALFGYDPRLWASLTYLAAVGLVFLPDLYSKLELLVKIVVGLMLVAFVGTLLMVGIDVQAALAGLVPRFPDQASIFLTIGMLSTTFSIAAAVYQGYLMKEKKWGPEYLGKEGLDTFIGIGVLGTITAIILLTSAGAAETTVFSAQSMAAQLEPLAGPAAFYLFVVGFFFASFSSLLVNPLVGATLLVDGLGYDVSMDARPVKLWTTFGMTVGLTVVLIAGEAPVEMIRIAQGLSVIAFPVLGFLLLAISRDREIMGAYAGRGPVFAVAILGYAVILGIVLNYIRLILD